MRAVRAGDVAQLAILFERYHRALFEFLARLTGDRGAAEDLVQDVFVRVLKYRATFRDDASFQTWLYRIARNARADYFRRRAPFEPLGDDELERPEPGLSPVRLLENERDRARLRRALLELRDDRREIIILARYQNLKHEQIADILGIDVGAVKVRVHRAIRDLRERFHRLRDETSPCDVMTSRRSLQII
jgi:RNA polymerase sigma factor (sigma-70 family)